MKSVRHGRRLFVGDAAHQGSPFGARGANSGIQDVDDLLWKLALVMQGKANEALLDSYNTDRCYAADENIRNSTRSTDYITPKSAVSRLFRQATLDLARHHPFARKLVNSGRLSVPTIQVDSVLNTPDAEPFAGDMVPGAPLDDAPLYIHGQDSWLLPQLGEGFVLLACATSPAAAEHELPDLLPAANGLSEQAVPVQVKLLCQEPSADAAAPWPVLHDAQGLAHRRLDLRPGSCYLIRPDQHVAARWRRFDLQAVQAALARATQSAMAPA